MAELSAKVFLKNHQVEIKNKTRNPAGLSDFLCEKNCIKAEMYSNINKQETRVAQMREIYNHLNTEKAYQCVYDWLKENEPDLIKELEDRNETENAEPERKRLRSDEDEPANTLNLKTLTTMAKLEEWVSDPKNSQKLIYDLEKKLSQGEMERLEDQLKDKKLKKSLCITAKEINEIRRKKELQLFLQSANNATFPTSLLGLFFEKDINHVTPVKGSEVVEEDADEEKPTQIHLEASGSSGYGPLIDHSLSQTNEQLQLDMNPHTTGLPRDTAVPCKEKKTRNADLDFVSPAEDLGSRSLLACESTVIQKKSEINVLDVDQNKLFSTSQPAVIDDTMPSEGQPQLQLRENNTSNVPDGPNDQIEFCCTSLPSVVDGPMLIEGLQDPQFQEGNKCVLNNVDVFNGHQDQNVHHGTYLTPEAGDLMQNEKLQDLQFEEGSDADALKHPNFLNGHQDQKEHYDVSLPAVVDEPIQNEGLQDLQYKQKNDSDVPNYSEVFANHQSQQLPVNFSATQERREEESMALHQNTSGIQLETRDDRLEETMDIQENLYESNEQFNPTLGRPSDPALNSSTDVVTCHGEVKFRKSHAEGPFHPDITGHTLMQSTPLPVSKKPNNNRKNMQNKIKKNTERDRVFHNWAVKQCSGTREEIFNCVVIRDVVEHREYSFLKAENVWKYGGNQIIHLTDEKKLSIDTLTRLHYHMYVCDAQQTMVLGPGEEERIIERSFNTDLYLWCVSEVCVPALAVYKNIQRKKFLRI